MATVRKIASTPAVGVRALSAQATREKILKAATKVFAQHGYQGGSVDKISRAAKSVDRMIYYYFGSKEGDRKSTRLNSSHSQQSRMPSSA